jgi:hypothetical protein
MGVVKSNKAFTVRPMERQRIAQAVWLSLRSGYTSHYEPDPVPAFWIDHKHLPIKIKQRVERCVACPRRLLSLSQTDKRRQTPQKVQMADKEQIAHSICTKEQLWAPPGSDCMNESCRFAIEDDCGQGIQRCGHLHRATKQEQVCYLADTFRAVR